MKKRPVIGVLRENKNKWEKRAVLTPNDVKWFVERGIEVEVESSPIRVFKDAEYKKVGAKVVDKAQKASLLVGIKEPHLDDILDDKIYMIFSHTSKGQSYNMPLLKEFLERDVTLVDYEKITDITGRRLVCFGRFAGICGMVDSLYYYGKKLEWKGANNPFSKLKPAWKYHTLPEIKEDMERVRKRIQSKGLPRRIAPFMVGIIGHGHVSAGAQEIIDLLNPVEIRARHMYGIARNRNFANNDVYKIVFLQEEKVTNKKKKGFNPEEYKNDPSDYRSNMGEYLPSLNILINAGYWDKRFPKLVPKSMIRRAYQKKHFKLEFIGDISCDIDGSIEMNHRVTSPEEPVYTYDPKKNEHIDGYKAKGVTVLAVDNLPCEMPVESSEYFSKVIRDYIYQLTVNGDKNVTTHPNIPSEIRRSVITQNRKLTRDYRYLERYIS